MRSMPAAPDFRLYHSNALDILAGLLAQELRAAAPGQALLAPDVVLIPQVAMRRWLQATLAQAHGIAANLEFLTPGEFLQRALDANVPGAGEDIDAEAMRWRLYAALQDPALMREAALRPLRAYLGGDAGDDALKPWSLAGELASVFEKYQAWRRDWLLGWEAGQGKLDPQAALWRRVAGGRAHRARRIDDYLRRFASDDAAAPLPAGLPTRLFAFATLNVSPDVLRMIASQARVGTLHFYMPTPTLKYWGDLTTLAERLRAGTGPSGGRDGGAEAFADAEQENPLLQAWGAAGRDFVAVLGGYEVVHPSGEIAAYADPEEQPNDAPERDSLLQRLQRDLLHRRAPAAWREAVDRNDPSLQVHACHTRLREVQVLHDRLRGLLEDPRFEPPLEPREIAVLAPDIDPYAPYIQAVFGGLAGRPDFIPYALADASPLVAEPLAEVFLRLLALPVSRFGLSEVLDLLATPAIAEHAGLDASALDRLRHWLQEAGARWGLDAAHRTRHDAPADDAYTWAFALDRLLLGHASGSDGDIAGVAPWTALEGTALHALDALIRLLRVLARHERGFANALSPETWRERVLGLLEALLPATPTNPSDQRTLERLRTALDTFASSAARADFDAPVPPEVLRAHFQTVLSDADTRAPLLTGGVSFGRMVPMRLLPFRAICVLGMNDGDYPRRDPSGGLNQLTAELGTNARRRGDRSLRDDDRFLFLQLFAAAGDVFHVSYLGADPRDGSQREPSL
ncbi:MAG: exodeoxyribonuclease V subunit gamma, partial [Pseudomonadota bacterium]|nr:exodeoxyribonuclease V subunit gamma [Pseudomonadota bacterium]